jgi:L-iditol 2-dehydrogenase
MPPDLPATMRGALLLGPERIEVRRVPVPRPLEGELVVKIAAATTCGTDVKVFRRGGHPRMLKAPALFGHEAAGTVAAAGPGAGKFSPGDAVVVANSACCGRCAYCKEGRENLCDDLQYLNGAFAEYLHVPARFVERSTYPVPEGLPFEVAALAEPLACVLHGIEACELGLFDRAGGRSAGSGGAEAVVYGAGPIGLLFTAALARAGHPVLLADPNPDRLEIGRRLGAATVLQVARGGGQAARVREKTEGGRGAQVAIDATGVPEVWADAIQSVRPGGLVNLFGGCAPGTTVPLDTSLIHYSEITVKGVYHHRPGTFQRALSLLAERSFEAGLLLSAERTIEEVEDALRSMMRKESLKVVIKP